MREANPGKKVTFEFPARICVDGVVVRDGFPDWYPILQGSRVSCSQQTQENYATSMCSETGSVRNESSNIRPLSMGQQIESVLRDTTDTTDLRRSQMPTQQPNSSPVRMEDDGPRSPSLFDSINASAPKEGPTEGNPNNRLRSRGRSPTRKPVTSNKQRAQSSSTRGRRGANPARRSYACSQSRSAQSKVPFCVDQAAGATNFKKPNPIDQNNPEREKKNPVVPILHKLTPPHSTNQSRTLWENVQTHLPHAQPLYTII